MNNKFCLVEWEQPVIGDSEWTDIPTVLRFRPPITVTCGLLIAENETELIVASTFQPQLGRVSGVTAIPRRAVRSLQLGDSGLLPQQNFTKPSRFFDSPPIPSPKTIEPPTTDEEESHDILLFERDGLESRASTDFGTSAS